MYRSASTWQYNVAGYLVEQSRAGRRAGYCSHADPLVLAAPGWQVFKAHEADPVFADMLAHGQARALYAFRDLRDVAYSLIHKANNTFEAVIESDGLLDRALANFRFWTSQSHTLVQRYEDLVADPVAGVRAIAAHLAIPLPAGAAEHIAEEFSLEKNRERMRRVAEHYRSLGVDLHDPANALCRDEQTQWHWNHIRDGRVGGWRSVATPRELMVLARRCGRWLIEQGYEPDYAWAVGALDYVLFEEHERLLGALADAHRGWNLVRADLEVHQRQILHLGARLRELEDLGPAALRLARLIHALAMRHPHARALLKRGLGTVRRLLRRAVNSPGPRTADGSLLSSGRSVL